MKLSSDKHDIRSKSTGRQVIQTIVKIRLRWRPPQSLAPPSNNFNNFSLCCFSQKSDISAPPIVTGETILNQKPAQEYPTHGRAKSADFTQHSSEFVNQKRYLFQTQSSQEDDQDIVTSKSRLFNKRELSAKSNGLVYALHKVHPDRFGKTATTMYSQITKPLTAGSPTNRKPVNGYDSSSLNINSARL